MRPGVSLRVSHKSNCMQHNESAPAKSASIVLRNVSKIAQAFSAPLASPVLHIVKPFSSLPRIQSNESSNPNSFSPILPVPKSTCEDRMSEYSHCIRGEKQRAAPVGGGWPKPPYPIVAPLVPRLENCDMFETIFSSKWSPEQQRCRHGPQ